MKDKDTLLSPSAVAAYLGIPLATVYQMNHRGTGPRRSRVGKHVRYRLADVDRWLDQRAVETDRLIGRAGGGA